MSAIRLKVKKAQGKHDLGTSKFLGSPTLPDGWVDEINGDIIFLLQIRLEEIKDLDKDNMHNKSLYKNDINIIIYITFFINTK